MSRVVDGLYLWCPGLLSCGYASAFYACRYAQNTFPLSQKSPKPNKTTTDDSEDRWSNSTSNHSHQLVPPSQRVWATMKDWPLLIKRTPEYNSFQPGLHQPESTQTTGKLDSSPTPPPLSSCHKSRESFNPLGWHTAPNILGTITSRSVSFSSRQQVFLRLVCRPRRALETSVHIQK